MSTWWRERGQHFGTAAASTPQASALEAALARELQSRLERGQVITLMTRLRE